MLKIYKIRLKAQNEVPNNSSKRTSLPESKFEVSLLPLLSIFVQYANNSIKKNHKQIILAMLVWIDMAPHEKLLGLFISAGT